MVENIDPNLVERGRQMYIDGADPLDVIADCLADDSGDNEQKALMIALGYIGGLIWDIRAIRKSTAATEEIVNEIDETVHQSISDEAANADIKGDDA
jgi:hypothetical protein